MKIGETSHLCPVEMKVPIDPLTDTSTPEASEKLADVIHSVSFLQRCLLWPATFFFRVWCRTLRIEWQDKALEKIEFVSAPAIFVFWHNHIFLAFACRRFLKRPYPMGAMTSASKDGAWVAAMLHNISLLGIRGSSHRRGAKALRHMHTAIKGGVELCITPDGSRGPCYYLRPGCIQLSRSSRTPLLLCAATFHNSWRLRSWDRFHLPKPFSRITVRMNKVLPEELDAFPDNESARVVVENRLRGLLDPNEQI